MPEPPVDPPFKRILIANRGEIAVRIIRACRDIGIAPIAVYSDGEENAVHVRLADDAYRITSETGLAYLDIEQITDVARRAGVDAVHPGYGFLAENAAFAAACESAGLTFVGPPAAAIEAMGDKVRARRIAIEAGVPVVPGSDGLVATVEEARQWADQLGYPVAMKASAGGGGRGFRVVASPHELDDAFAGATSEARRSFGNADLYLERYLVRPRHVEAQIFADHHGQVVFLGERDCSIQRRHQKLIEETPSPAVTDEIREQMAEASRSLAKAVDYRGAGTVEFILGEDGSLSFLEMNTRIQVEHTVTEAVTGLDLVVEQFLVAAGHPLSWSRDEIAPRGHAIEFRLNAEDAGRDFAPAPGTVETFVAPGGIGVRVDSAMEAGAAILPAYDSLIAKLVVWGGSREQAIARARRALRETVVSGLPTTIPFHLRVLDHPAFRSGAATTSFLTDYPEVLPPPAEPIATTGDGPAREMRDVIAEVNGRRLLVRLPAELSQSRNDNTGPRRPRIAAKDQQVTRANQAGDGHDLISPIQGTVVRVIAEAGQPVARGDAICVIEAMKMENDVVAHRDGTIESLGVAPGAAVRIGEVIATIR